MGLQLPSDQTITPDHLVTFQAGLRKRMCFYTVVSRALGYREHLGRVCKPSPQGKAQGAGAAAAGWALCTDSGPCNGGPAEKPALGGRMLCADGLVPM